MAETITVEEIASAGCQRRLAEGLARAVRPLLSSPDPVAGWLGISKQVLRPDHPFALHQLLFQKVYAQWDEAELGPPPAWAPTDEEESRTNIAWLATDLGLESYEALHTWSRDNQAEFWSTIIDRLGIRFRKEPEAVADLSRGPTQPRWLPGAELNITESCFLGPRNRVAVVFQPEEGPRRTLTLADLDLLSNRVANGIRSLDIGPGQALAVDLPMTVESVAIYLGIVKAGCVVVSIADSFAAEEIATRLQIAGARAIFTQDVIVRGRKTVPLYEKVCAASAPQAIVVICATDQTPKLRRGDRTWEEFLSEEEEFIPVAQTPAQHTNILFSSGTTGDPKAIPWSQTTPIKCGADGHLHHDIRPGDVVAWPTNLGWMMGPWLIYASLLNGASMALYGGPPGTKGFGRFVQDARVTMLGVVPSLVKSWRESGCLEGLDWSSIRAFSSTGECSNRDDMLFLMARAGYKPIIEYCGGTEVGGGYITGTMVQPAAPATFTTPALGLDLVILGEDGKEAREGEAFIIPPSIGLSDTLLNRDHDEVYHAGVPQGPRGETLRRHGDQLERLAGGLFRAHGRVDDTMNLSGVKVSSAEIERAVLSSGGLSEVAAVALAPEGGGPSRLVLYVVLQEAGAAVEKAQLLAQLQPAIRNNLNPLFKIHDVVVVEELPRTASNKVMRRMLRARKGGSL
ncbi:AMP-binding protein [Planctomycetota bacterium]